MKKYNWIRTTKESREGKLMRVIQRRDNGLELYFIYESLFFLALDTDGVIEYEGYEDTFEEEILYSINNPMVTLEGVQDLLELLESRELIQREPAKIRLLEFSSRVGTESSAERVRRHREKKQAEELVTEESEPVTECNEDEMDCSYVQVTGDEDVTQCNSDVTTCNADVTQCNNSVTDVTKCNVLEREKEKERDKEKDKKPKKPGKDQVISQFVKQVVECLNMESGSAYRPGTRGTIALVKARINEGYSVSDFEKVIRYKSGQWKHDKKMSRYLRPETLFGNKFEGYLQEALREESKTGYQSNYSFRTERPELEGETEVHGW